MEPPECTAGTGLEISWVRGSRYWEKLSKRVYINNHYFINTQVFLFIEMFISFYLPPNAFLFFILFILVSRGHAPIFWI